MIKLSKTWLNLSYLAVVYERWDGVDVVLSTGDMKTFRGEDAQKIREALDYEAFENRRVMERVESDRPKPEETLRDLERFSKEFGPQEDGTLIAR